MNKPNKYKCVSRDGEINDVYFPAEVDALLDSQQSKLDEQSKEIERLKQVAGVKWIDVNQEMPTPDLDTFVIAKFTQKFMSTPGLYSRRTCEIVSTKYLSMFARNYTHWAALPDAPEVADSKRGVE